MGMSSWQPTGLTAGELARMQQDAERRVEEMRRRVQQNAGFVAPEPEDRMEYLPDQIQQPVPSGESLPLFYLLAALLRGEEEQLPLLAALAWLLL